MSSYTTMHAIATRQIVRTLQSHLPMIVAELLSDCEIGRQGQTIYLVRPDQHDLPNVTAILRSQEGELYGGDVPWSWLRNPRIEFIPAHIAERCVTGSQAELTELLTTIVAKHCPRRQDFGLQIDLRSL